MRSFVTASIIAKRLCSPSRDGQELLPQLIAKLITASIPKEAIREFRFPHGDQIYLHGADGILAVNDDIQHLYVPSGISVWEMGTSMDPKSKADEDFGDADGKLAQAFPNVTPPVVPDKATFVFVTSKSWESKKWIGEKRKASNWKNIKVLDAVDLEKWLEQCPAVMLWFADVCSLPAEGLYDAEQFLRKVGVSFGVSAMSPELIIAGRNIGLSAQIFVKLSAFLVSSGPILAGEAIIFCDPAIRPWYGKSRKKSCTILNKCEAKSQITPHSSARRRFSIS